MASLRGHVLIASPTLGEDPNFARTVVLIAEHTEDGALGLVLNRPSESTVAESVESLDGLARPGEPVWFGGPVATEAVMVLAEWLDPTQAAVVVLDDVGFVPADADFDELEPLVRRARVFAGHSGWGPGQLDAELAEGAWIVAPADRDEVFAEEGTDVWASALTRLGGGYALLARVPEDPSLN